MTAAMTRERSQRDVHVKDQTPPGVRTRGRNDQATDERAERDGKADGRSQHREGPGPLPVREHQLDQRGDGREEDPAGDPGPRVR